jgi:serine protease
VAGVVALMKAEDPQRLLKRDRFISILKSTASYQGLTITDTEAKTYSSQPRKIRQHLFGSGLVNADAAVRQVKRRR